MSRGVVAGDTIGRRIDIDATQNAINSLDARPAAQPPSQVKSSMAETDRDQRELEGRSTNEAIGPDSEGRWWLLQGWWVGWCERAAREASTGSGAVCPRAGTLSFPSAFFDEREEKSVMGGRRR